jgi:hypothetical protein
MLRLGRNPTSLELSVGKGLIVAGALALIVGGGALGYGLTRPKPAVVVDAAPFASKLEAMLDEHRGSLRQRADGVAKEDYVKTGLSTDVETAQGMYTDAKGGELKLMVQPGEVMEFGQVIAGAATRFLLVPPDGKPWPTKDGKPGDQVAVTDDGLVLQRVSMVQLYSTQFAPAGYVAITQRLAAADFAQLNKELEAANTGLHIVVGDKRIALGKPFPAGVKTNQQPSKFDPVVMLEAAVPMGAGNFLPFLIAGGGGAGLGLLLLVLGMMGKRSGATAATSGIAVASGGSNATPVGFAATEATGLAVGTPAGTSVGGSSAGAFAPAPAALGPGAVLGRWEIVQRLGSGGMADVFKARSLGEAGFAKMVALKVMHGHLARSPRAVDHFLDEARLAAQIHHPNVVQILDLGKIGNEYAIAMEFVDGVDLDRLLQGARASGRAVPLNVAVGVLRRICDGVAAAHNAVGADGTPLQIVHRDIKAANVLVSRQGSVKVVDFGIAKAAVQSHFTVAGETKGTPSMMAPEQRVGDVVDKRADVYSLAAVGYELLTGAAVNLDMATIAHLGIAGWPHLPKPSELRPGVPVEFDNILLKAMAYERTDRPDSCEIFEAQIEQVAQLYALAASDKDIGRWVANEMQSGTDGESTEIGGRPLPV